MGAESIFTGGNYHCQAQMTERYYLHLQKRIKNNCEKGQLAIKLIQEQWPFGTLELSLKLW